MPISTTHNIHTGCIVCASDLSPLLASLEGEIVPNPLNAPHLQELTSGGTITDSTTYRYRYSYISWRITNGVMEITEESRCSPIAALTTGTNGNTARIQVIYAPPAYGTANGVIIYIENTGNPGQYYAKGIITDIVTQSWIDTTVGFTDKTRQPMPINTFQASQPMMPVGSKLGLPIPFKNLTENLVATTVSSGSPYIFTKNQDFLLMSVTYQSVATDSTSVEVYTTASGFRVWIHDEVNSTESSHFVFPVPIPYTETGISVSAGTVAIIGAYTGINRSYVPGIGKSVNIFCSQIQGPTASPSK